MRKQRKLRRKTLCLRQPRVSCWLPVLTDGWPLPIWMEATVIDVACTQFPAMGAAPIPCESRAGHVACPELHTHKLSRLRSHNKRQRGNVSRAFDGNRNGRGEFQSKDLVKKDLREWIRRSSRLFPAPAIHRTSCQIPCPQRHPQGRRRSCFRAAQAGSELRQGQELRLSCLRSQFAVAQHILVPAG